MNHYHGIALEYRVEKRMNYMSLTDLFQDLTTDCLIKVLPTIATLSIQMSLMKEIEKRNELSDEVFYELLESCNGI